jgi:hypothetical protein
MPRKFFQLDHVLITCSLGLTRACLRAVAICLSTSVAAAVAEADPWLAPGNGRLRHDLQLLADAGIVRAPLSAWPVSWPEISRDVGQSPPASLSLHVEAALERVRAAAREATRTGDVRIEASIAVSEQPMALRRFDNVPRESGEASVGVQYLGRRFAFRAQANGVADPADGEELRPDGSYVGVVLGNWMLHAGYVDRWWGPGWEGSLVYGSNQRPIPSVTIERNYSDTIDHPWLEWIGQWRLVATMGQLESDREDAPNAQLFGMRATWKPHARVEIGLSRTAQWCGDGRPCDAGTFWDLFHGNDNDQLPEEQPGNQLAGFDARWALPWAPVAVYGQMIGEDEANFLPSQYLGLFGVELTGGFGDRSWRAHIEYSDTACSFYDSEPNFGCAYRNAIYTDGYQYRDRSIGHALDGDSEQFALGILLANADGSSWQLAAQSADVNRASQNPVHSVELEAARIYSADLYHRRALWGGDLSVGVGYERREREGAAPDTDDVRGFVQWKWGTR